MKAEYILREIFLCNFNSQYVENTDSIIAISALFILHEE